MVEMVAALLVLTIGLLGAFAAANSGQEFAGIGRQLSRNDAGGRTALGPLQDLIGETRMEFIDTSLRSHYPSGFDYDSDRFTLPHGMVSQCTSPICRFHTNQALVPAENRYQCGFEYRSAGGLFPLARGKIWPAGVLTCPLDGAPVSSTGVMDILKTFTARDEGGSFVSSFSGASSGPRWSGLALVFPYAEPGQLPELRRVDIYVDDLFGPDGVVSSSADWTAWDPTQPTMIDLWDFGGDGSADGVPDGSVPVSASTSDADSEHLYIGSSSGSPAIVHIKSLDVAGGYPSRSATLVVHMDTGAFTLSVSHYEAAGTYWTGSVSMTRTPRTLATDVTEFAVSTARSHPHDPATNPTGVADTNAVRVTLVTSADNLSRGTRTWVHHLDTVTLSPRN